MTTLVSQRWGPITKARGTKAVAEKEDEYNHGGEMDNRKG